MAGKTFRGVTDEDRRKSPASSLGGGVSKGTEADYGEHGNKIGHLGNTSGSGSSGTSGSRYGGIGSGGLGSLGGGSYPSGGASSSGSGSSSSRITNDFKYSPYNPSDAVLAAKARLEELQRPGDYQSKWQDQLQASLDAILGRKAFQYDLNGDALYQQYKEQYQNLGQQAMMDTMGQAAALTGGYGNSYASTAGNQAYHQYLQGLNDKVPELAALARQNYDKDTQAMYDRANLINAMENQDYGRWSDEYNRWDAERQYLYNIYNNERDYDYGKYTDDRNFQYNMNRDNVSDQQWQATFDENRRQFDLEYELSRAAQAAAAASAAASRSSSGYGSGSSGGSGSSSGGGSGSGSGSGSGGTTTAKPKLNDNVAANTAASMIRSMVQSGGMGEEYIGPYLNDMVKRGKLTKNDAGIVLAWYEEGMFK